MEGFTFFKESVILKEYRIMKELFMRVAVVGSRSIREIDLGRILQQIPDNCSEIVSGGASGVDSIARDIASRLSVPMKEFLPDYHSFGRTAPFQRNQEIADYCDMLVAVWDYRSKGTRDVLLRALKLQKKVKIVMVDAMEENEKE